MQLGDASTSRRDSSNGLAPPRLIVSMAMCDGAIYTQDNWAPAEIESLDISTAFLRGLNYKDLAAAARRLGYESRIECRVVISHPENFLRLFC